MLEKLDLKQKLDKKEYDKKMDYYGDLLGKLQVSGYFLRPK